MPEAVIAGHISLPSSEAPDKIGLQFFRRLVQNGIAQWVPAGNTTSKSNGDFRFAELMPGTYKLLTRELLDRDPLNTNSHAQQYGYPPVYYPDADDFASAAEIRLSPGEVSGPRLTLVKQPYYSVKVAVANTQPSTFGMNVNVASQKGHAGPGYALNYDSSTQTIEGLLPNGTYTVEASSFGRSSAAGAITLVVKGAAVTGAKLTLEPAASVVINVREEFANKPPETSFTFTQGRRSFNGRGPRRYLNVSLESADEFNFGRNGFLRPPSGPDDTALEIQDVLPGRYWVRVRSAYGYAAVVRSGSTNLLRDPLVVGAGGATIPVEITMRDDSAQIAGQVEQLAAGLAFLPLAMLGGGRPIHWDIKGIGAVLYLVTFGSIVGYSAFVYAMDKLPVALVSMYTYVNPIVALFLGWLFYREPFGPTEAAGMAVIFLGVALVKRYSPAPTAVEVD